MPTATYLPTLVIQMRYIPCAHSTSTQARPSPGLTDDRTWVFSRTKSLDKDVVGFPTPSLCSPFRFLIVWLGWTGWHVFAFFWYSLTVDEMFVHTRGCLPRAMYVCTSLRATAVPALPDPASSNCGVSWPPYWVIVKQERESQILRQPLITVIRGQKWFTPHPLTCHDLLLIYM